MFDGAWESLLMKWW